MTTAFAAAELRLGRATAARLGNAQVSFNGGSAVDCIFSNTAQVSPVGQAGAYSRDPQVSCLIADVLDVSAGVAAVIVHHGVVGAYYKVKQRLPDDLHTGWVTFLLEPAA